MTRFLECARGRIRHGVVLGVIAVLIPVAARAQVDSRLSQRLDSATARAIGAIVDSAVARGLPAEPLVEQALQGAARRAPGERIVTAVRALRAGLDSARSALRVASDAELVVGAVALRAGAGAPALGALRAALPGRSLVVPLAVLADLRAQGRPVAEATRVVLDLARRGATDADFAALGRSVVDGRRERSRTPGVTPTGSGVPGGLPGVVPSGPAAPPPGRPAPSPPVPPGSGQPGRP